jgi:hypothetical protein
MKKAYYYLNQCAFPVMAANPMPPQPSTKKSTKQQPISRIKNRKPNQLYKLIWES